MLKNIEDIDIDGGGGRGDMCKMWRVKSYNWIPATEWNQHFIDSFIQVLYSILFWRLQEIIYRPLEHLWRPIFTTTVVKSLFYNTPLVITLILRHP
jgi:hypothetical protein